MSLPPGSTLLDFSFARPPADRVKALGYSGGIGYISVAPSNPAKNWTRAEMEVYRAAELATGIVWEMSATRPNGGKSAGLLDGWSANGCCRDLAYPTEATVLFAFDTNTVAANIAAHEDYGRAAAGRCDHPFSAYGDLDILSRLLDIMTIGWVPNAWSWSASSRAELERKADALAAAHVLQRLGFALDGKWNVDPNVTIKPIELYGAPASPAAPPPQPTTTIGDDMALPIICNAQPLFDIAPKVGKFVVMDDGTIRHLTPTEYRARVLASGKRLDDPANVGDPWTNDEISAAGTYRPPLTEPSSATPPPSSAAWPTLDLSLGLNLDAGTATGVAVPRVSG